MFASPRETQLSDRVPSSDGECPNRASALDSQPRFGGRDSYATADNDGYSYSKSNFKRSQGDQKGEAPSSSDKEYNNRSSIMQAEPAPTYEVIMNQPDARDNNVASPDQHLMNSDNKKYFSN